MQCPTKKVHDCLKKQLQCIQFKVIKLKKKSIAPSITSHLSEQLKRRSCSRNPLPWAIKASRSISPKRIPPCRFRPYI